MPSYNSNYKKNKKKIGFTFIEVIATLAIIAILTSVAFPSYQRYVLETRRSDAYIALTLAAAEQERNFAISSRYLSNINKLGGEYSPQRFYYMDVEVVDVGYRLAATVIPEGAQAPDTECLQMTLDHLGAKLPSMCW